MLERCEDDSEGFSPEQKQGLYRAIFERRDVRSQFRPDPIPHAILTRVLTAAHHAPSVGFMQPWDFIVIDDPAVKIVPLPMTRPGSPASSLDTEMYRVLEQVSQRMYPGSTVLPTMSTGASDKAQLRNKGVQSYGIGPYSTDEDSAAYGAHGDVERLLETALYNFVEFDWSVVTQIAAKR